MDRQQNTVDAELMSWHDLEERHAWSGILIGNGASRTVWEKFRYESLYQTAKSSNIEHQLSSEDRRIFEQLGTENFEQILGALAISEFVLGSIYRSDYLSFAYQQFAQHSGPLVVFGSSLDVNHDDHLVKAMSRWIGRSIAISVYPSTSERDIVVFKADLQRRLPDASLYFFDSTTAPLGSSDLRVADSETI